MLVDGFNDLHGFRASVPDDDEFDGVMGFAVPVLHVSVKECGAALLYEFGICASIRGQCMLVEGLSMGEMVTINREIARAIREAKHARSL